MPKKSGLINEIEVAIGARVKQFRENIKWQQPGFAYELGISRDKLASIEYGRTPLRFELAKRLCERFDLSQCWLARGIGQPHPCIPFSPDIEGQIPVRSLFSEAFYHHLLPAIGPNARKLFEVGKSLGMKVKFATPIGFSEEKRVEWMLTQEVRAAFSAIPMELRADFCHEVLSAADNFCSKHRVKRSRLGLIRPRDWPKDKPFPIAQSVGSYEFIRQDFKMDLTDTESYEKLCSDMKLQLPSLLDRLNQATKEAGKMTALADFLGKATRQKVPLASVSRWLSGKREPGGEIALLLLTWVEQQERQK